MERNPGNPRNKVICYQEVIISKSQIKENHSSVYPYHKAEVKMIMIFLVAETQDKVSLLLVLWQHLLL